MERQAVSKVTAEQLRAAVAVVKGLNDQGQVIYCRLQTSDITVIEAIGMHEAAAAMHKASLPGVR